MRSLRINPFKGNYRFFRPWLIAASVWGICGLVVLDAHVEQVGTEHLKELWFLMSLLWIQFGFAAVFHSLLKQRGRRFLALLLITLLPPLLLYLIILFAVFGLP